MKTKQLAISVSVIWKSSRLLTIQYFVHTLSAGGKYVHNHNSPGVYNYEHEF